MSENTRQKILASAKGIFLEKGFAGARMRDIAEKANINKGLLHYYFKTKRLLFLEVLKILVVSFVPEVDSIFGMQLNLFEKIDLFVDKYIDMLCMNKQIPFFIAHEMNLNTEEFINFILKIDEITSINTMGKLQQFQEEIDKGNINDINPVHLLLNIISMSVFPFIARPGIQKLTGMSDDDFIHFMKLRKRIIVDTIISSIKK
jgi:AcrR family transcriptional regulator